MPPPERLNMIGMAFSFGWNIGGLSINDANWRRVIPNIDLELARAYFEAAAAEGYWAGLNNLGVMLRDGLGGPPDAERARALFEQAAESLEPRPMRHLARCLREGIGGPIDEERAAFLDELADALEAKDQDQENPAPR